MTTQPLQAYGPTPEAAMIGLSSMLRELRIKRYTPLFKQCPYTGEWTAYIKRTVQTETEAE